MGIGWVSGVLADLVATTSTRVVSVVSTARVVVPVVVVVVVTVVAVEMPRNELQNGVARLSLRTVTMSRTPLQTSARSSKSGLSGLETRRWVGELGKDAANCRRHAAAASTER